MGLSPTSWAKRDENDPLTERILEAGLEQLLTFGVRRLSVEDIARRLGIARVTIYRRFANKKVLVKAVIMREGRRIFAEVDAAVIGGRERWERRLHGLERELEERSAWALRLDRELEEQTALAVERTNWALQLNAELEPKYEGK